MDDSAPFPGNRRLYPLDTHSLSFKRNLQAGVDVFVEYTRFEYTHHRAGAQELESKRIHRYFPLPITRQFFFSINTVKATIFLRHQLRGQVAHYLRTYIYISEYNYSLE